MPLVTEVLARFSTARASAPIRYSMLKDIIAKIPRRLGRYSNDAAVRINNGADHIMRLIKRRPTVLSIDATIDEAIRNKCSISRYGDGELKLMAGLGICVQPFAEELASRLRGIIRSEEPRLLICLPDVFGSLNQYKEEEKQYWSRHLVKYRRLWYSVLKMDNVYYNAFISSFYDRVVDKSRCGEWFRMMQGLWEERDVVLVEGEESRLGVGNDLFDNVRSTKRILAPPENAFARYKDILTEVEKQDRSKLILIALGPTATVLVYDLHKLGFQAIDVGHIDIEYEWYLRKASTKIRIDNKYVVFVRDGTEVQDCMDPRYMSEIMCRIR